MATRRALKGINWAAFAERVSEEERSQFLALKSKFDEYARRMAANPESPPKLDWAYYKKMIVTPGLVDKFQKEYEALSIPYPEDKYSHLIDAMAKESQIQIQDFIKESNMRIEEHKKEIEKINNRVPYEEMTMEEYLQYHPEILNVDRPTYWPHYPEQQYHLTGELEQLVKEQEEEEH